ncbi:MAG: ATP-dependent DNA helicase RecG [Clostridia bacterium]|nr:ATP-dependent DNA helicase RecG [Clostridia bacterium]
MKILLDLNQNIQFVKGVGEVRAKQLAKMGIYTLLDLITYYPREYENRTNIKEIKDFVLGENVLFKARVVGKIVTRRIRKNLTIHSFYVGDSTGNIKITVFNQNYLRNTIHEGDEYAFYGKVEGNILKYEMNSPEIVDIGKMYSISGIRPVYPLVKGITNNYVISLMKKYVNDKLQLEEIFSNEFLAKYKLEEINKAVCDIHFPNNFADIEKARKRHIFEELYLIELALMSIKESNIKLNGIKFENVDVTEFMEQIPFELTNAQKNCLNEILQDMNSTRVMNRLVQGDVGSGKTIIAALAMYIAAKNGYQAAMMAPTTILATQHYYDLSKIFNKLGIKVDIITGKTTKKGKTEIVERLKNREIDILFGTHAILEDNVEFNKLGLVVTDEQHRFGVKQRMKLTNKSENVDTLVMTATPIPRTLALTLYSDLDISIIDELPKGRKPIKTNAVFVNESMEDRINLFISKQLDSGRQAYIVCPLIEETEDSDLTAATELYEKYKNDTFKKYNVGFLHGKMKNKEKDEIMQKFKNKEVDLLVSTTVIEVGVNVPNATIMVIEDAERFGLAALHQLRGRVGRGEHESFCVLKTRSKSKTSLSRLKIMESSNNGFVIAEKDLELRGPGDFFGIRQHGLPEFKLANLLKDMDLLKLAIDAAKETLKDDPKLEKEQNKNLKNMLNTKFGEALNNINN